MCAEAFQEPDDIPVPETVQVEEGQCFVPQVFLMLSSAAVSSSTSPRTMQLRGTLMGCELLILIDSGSSHSFFSTRFAEGLPNLVTFQTSHG